MKKTATAILFLLAGLAHLLTPSASAADNHHAWVRANPQTVAIGERVSGNGPEHIYVSYSEAEKTIMLQVSVDPPRWMPINAALSSPGLIVFGDRLVTASNMDGGTDYYVHAPDYVLREAHPSG